ncbi:MAG: hypothetical protein RSC43_03215, partial [Clostridia bacterium]
DYIIEKVDYSFKDGNYHARISSPSGIDTYFSLSMSGFGKLCRDNYGDMVANGRNTWNRVDDEYRKMVKSVFESESFPYISYISFGAIREKYSSAQGSIYKDFGLDAKKLVLDKAYDVRALGAKYGELTFYAQDENVSAKRASEILLDITKILDAENVPFYAITFVLQKPRNEDTPNPDDSEIHVTDFLHSDIYEAGLVGRVQKSHDKTMAYFADEDAKKQTLL